MRESSSASRWPQRFAVATLLMALPLLFFGGTVTTLHAGLAIDGWWILEPGRGDHFLWLYPLEKWFRDTGTFVEHTHRQIGSLVGLLAIGTVISTFVAERRRAARWIAVAALLAVAFQGTLGGLRVLEKSDSLAFLHGVVGQLVFALLGATALVLSPRWATAPAAAIEGATALRTSSRALALVVAIEMAVGAWLRHGGSTLALAVHGLLVIVVVAAVVQHVRHLSRAQADDRSPATLQKRFAWLRTTLLAVLAGQIALGLFAFVSIYFVVGRSPTEIQQSVWPTLHVMGGALLLLRTVTGAMWCRRSTSPRASLDGMRDVHTSHTARTPRAARTMGGTA